MFLRKQSVQKGSSSSLVLVVMVSAILLFGAIYYLRQRGENIRQEQATEQYEKNKAAEKADNDKNADTTVVDVQKDTATTAAVGETHTNLPTTGPESILLESIGLFFLVAFLTAYLGSKRELSYYL